MALLVCLGGFVELSFGFFGTSRSVSRTTGRRRGNLLRTLVLPMVVERLASIIVASTAVLCAVLMHLRGTRSKVLRSGTIVPTHIAN